MKSKLLVVFVAIILISANLFGQTRTRINFSKDDPWGLFDDWDKYFFFPDERSKNVYTVGKPFGDFYTAYFDTNEYAIFINPDSAKKGDTISLIFGMSITLNAPYAYLFDILFNYKLLSGKEDSLAIQFSMDGDIWESIYYHKILKLTYSVISGSMPSSPPFPYKCDVESILRIRINGDFLYSENNNIDTFLLRFIYFKNSDSFQRGFLLSELEFEFIPGTSIQEIQNGNFEIYPNPIDDYTEIKFSENFKQEFYYLEILDMHGRIVHSATLKNSRNKVNLSSLAKGIYLLKISDESGNVLVSKRVFKEQ
jgi:hypothetical protein